MRQSSRKSRHGCTECKRRHIKCDETRPSCANCRSRDRQCSFLLLVPSFPATPASSTSSSLVDSSHNDSFSLANCASTSDTYPPTPLSQDEPVTTLYPNPLSSSTNQLFKLPHLELLLHFGTDMRKDLTLEDTEAGGFIDLALQEAIKTPYLMDQIIAVSAAHMSTKRPDQENFYRDEATYLQTRALAIFNAGPITMSDDNCLAVFLFSILLAQQVLFDTLSTRANLSTFLDKMVSCLTVCGGIRGIAGQSWQSIDAQFRRHDGRSTAEGWADQTEDDTSITTEFSRLDDLVDNTDLSASSRDAYIQAVNLLQRLSSAAEGPQDSSLRCANLALRWAVMVPSDFVRLVDQRRPEALIVLAYYAVLIYEARDFWAFGDAGEFIIQTITISLGTYWAKWLAWPNEVLSRAGNVQPG
ncbi:uncharacterized protein BDR25DRAFT_303505 [Lindgomyces ingoldianus]|uniref:Uncharacterized protein n=1 Tax=Lindgomyces ingoldianus TaxID=673940 RepID=A0ACB6QWF0_9PLEO|nr:uncharacterized protein BDR25DRAFT_303505 [Lindgomyces ingoldianus]KAF2470903.1 hypothetical protein BDR25DRAFT_303505 [Lindgomyces ingoldianus]